MVTAVEWKDNRLSYFLSTVGNVDKCNVTRRNKKGVEEMVEAPSLVKMYNQEMGGVDRGDQGKQRFLVSSSVITEQWSFASSVISLAWPFTTSGLCTTTK